MSGKPVGIWIRVSTEDQAQGESPAHHEGRARAYATAKGWDVQEVYDLSGVSGKSVMEHSETKRMLSDAATGHITGLIFSKLARLARNTRELLDFADIFRGHGADLISLSESIDTSSPAGRLFFTMVAAMAQWEREEIAERVAVSVPIRAKMGKPTGGQASFGYAWKDGELVPEPDEVPIRKLVYELFLEHRRKKTVARMLNERGYRTRKGARFSDTTVERLLRDLTARGTRRANYTRSTGRGKSWELKPQEDWIEHPVEAIVSEELWDTCNRILDEQRTSRKRPARKAVHLFSGFATCECGNKMYVPSNTPKYVCYKCRNKIPVVDLEGVFHEQLKSFVFSDQEIRDYLQGADTRIKEHEEQLVVLSRERQSVQKEMDKLYELYQADEIPRSGFGERYRPLEMRRDAIDGEIPKTQAALDVMKINYLSSDQIISDARDLYSRWQDLSQEEKRSIVEAITESIVIGDGEIAIHLNYIQTEPYLDQDSDTKATLPQGFIAATSCTRAG